MSNIRDPGHAKIVGDLVKDLRKRIPYLDMLKADSIGVEIEKGSVVGINLFNCEVVFTSCWRWPVVVQFAKTPALRLGHGNHCAGMRGYRQQADHRRGQSDRHVVKQPQRPPHQ